MSAQELLAGLRDHGIAAVAMELLPGDLSPRRYARVTLDGDRESSAILAIYPSDFRSTADRYLAATALLERIAVPVPRVLAIHPDRDWILLEDLGPSTLAELRDASAEDLARLFDRAAEHARRIATLPRDEVGALNPPLDGALLRRELAQTEELFLAPRALRGDAATAAQISSLFDEICTRIGDEPLVPCHRDFMARNLIPRADRADLVVIDHQDLRLGPPRYDLASLLNDTLFPAPEIEADLLDHLESDVERESYHRTAAQRTLKAVGTYAKFASLGISRHLPLVPVTLARALGHLGRTREGAAWAPRLTDLWRSALPSTESRREA